MAFPFCGLRETLGGLSAPDEHRGAPLPYALETAPARCLVCDDVQPKPLLVFDQRHRHAHGPVAGGRVEGAADELPSLGWLGGFGRGGILGVHPAPRGLRRPVQQEDPARGRALRGVPKAFTAGV